MKKLLSAVLCIALLIGIVPLCGLFAIPVSAADDDYTDPAHPYVATSFSGLREVFNKHRPDGKKIYIKLGTSIYYEATDYSFTLRTDGADVDLDLCGYTLSVNDRIGYSDGEPHALIYGQTGTVTVRDSAVDYSENDEEIKGKIVYEFEYGDEISVNTMIFTGDIVIESGYFQNKTKGKGKFYELNVGYYGLSANSLIMHGGIIEAPTPVVLKSSTKRSVIYHGVLRASTFFNAAIYLKLYYDNSINSTFSPIIADCKIVNKYYKNNVGDLGENYSYKAEFSDIDPKKESDKALETIRKVFPYLKEYYKDGSRKTNITDGLLLTNLMSMSCYAYFGPKFRNTFDIRSKTVIRELYVLTVTPKAGDSPDHFAYIYSGDGYKIEDKNSGNWINGVLWKTGVNGYAVSPGDVFEDGKRYTVYVSLVPENGYAFAPADIVKAVVNGKDANIYEYSDSNYGVYYTFRIPGKIDATDITVPEPAAGSHPSYTASAPSDQGYEIEDYNSSYWYGGVFWSEEDGSPMTPESTFSGGMSYTVTVSVILSDRESYYFADPDEIDATVNGEQAWIEVYGPSNYGICYTFTVESEVIDTIDVTVPEPKAGDPIYYYAAVPEDCGYRVQTEYNNGALWESGVAWFHEGEELCPQDENYFIAGDTYRVYVMIVLTDEDRYEFGNLMDMYILVNGHYAHYDNVSDTKYIIWYDFTVEAQAASDIKYGDVNGDGEITGKDLIRLRKYLNGEDVEIGPGADVNGDGSVTGKDLIRLRKYLNGENVVLGPG